MRDETRAVKRRIAVIVVHYNCPGMVGECLATLLPQLGRGDEVIVVENGSAAEQAAEVRRVMGSWAERAGTRMGHGSGGVRGSGNEDAQRASPVAPEVTPELIPRVRLMESAGNLGFAGGNNLAIREVMASGGAEYFLLLNPDTLLRAGAVATLVAFLENHGKAAAVGPRLEYPDGKPQLSAFGGISPVSELLRGASIGPLSRLLKRWEVTGPVAEEAHAAAWLAGACVLMRGDFFDKAGLFDERFFLYFEEVDLFRRAAAKGLAAWYEPAAHVVHLVGQSSGIVRSSSSPRLPNYWFESRHRYFRKHFGYFGMLAADGLWLAGHVLHRLRKWVTGTSHAPVAQAETRDLLRHSVHQVLHPWPGKAGVT